MKKITKKIIEIWGINSIDSPQFLVFLLSQQIDEIVSRKCCYEVLKKELPDIISICVQYLCKMGLDPEKTVLERLEKRHVNHQDQIKIKYLKKWLGELDDMQAENTTPSPNLLARSWRDYY